MCLLIKIQIHSCLLIYCLHMHSSFLFPNPHSIEWTTHYKLFKTKSTSDMMLRVRTSIVLYGPKRKTACRSGGFQSYYSRNQNKLPQVEIPAAARVFDQFYIEISPEFNYFILLYYHLFRLLRNIRIFNYFDFID